MELYSVEQDDTQVLELFSGAVRTLSPAEPPSPAATEARRTSPAMLMLAGAGSCAAVLLYATVFGGGEAVVGSDPDLHNPFMAVVQPQAAPVSSEVPQAHVAPTGSAPEQLSDLELLQLLGNAAAASDELRGALQESRRRPKLNAARELSELLTHSSALVRLGALEELSARGLLANSKILAAVLALCSDEDFLVRGYALRSVSKLGTPEAAAVLRARLPAEENTVVKQLLVKLLAGLEQTVVGTL